MGQDVGEREYRPGRWCGGAATVGGDQVKFGQQSRAVWSPRASRRPGHTPIVWFLARPSDAALVMQLCDAGEVTRASICRPAPRIRMRSGSAASERPRHGCRPSVQGVPGPSA
jgi:hypothetical protein